MTIMSAIGMRRCDAQIDALRAEFGAILADRILEAEAVDFLWDARVRECYLGEHIDADIGDEWSQTDVSRIAFLSALQGKWHIGICLIDGEGDAVDLLWKRGFAGRTDAEMAFERTR